MVPRPTRTVWTTWSGYDGLRALPVQLVATPRGWRLGDRRFMCSACGARTSVTAGTIFDRTRTPLTVWFTVCWHFATAKDGISARSLKRVLEIGSCQTAWAMLHRLRSVLVRPGRDLPAGTVEVDETYIGGEEPELRGGRAKGKKVLTVVIAVEFREPGGFGRCSMAPLIDASGTSLETFVTQSVNPGTHQGSVDGAHMNNDLNEFVFRFNRRRSRSRGMLFYRVLELAVQHGPVRYQDLIATRRPREEPPVPPQTHDCSPSLERPPADRP